MGSTIREWAGALAFLAIAWGGLHISQRSHGLEGELRRRIVLVEALDQCIEHVRSAVSHGEIPRDAFSSGPEQTERLHARFAADGLVVREDRDYGGQRKLLFDLIDGTRAEIDLLEDVHGLRFVRARASSGDGVVSELRALLDGVR